MTIGQAPRFEGVICVGRNQFLDHAPRFEGCPVFRVPRYAGFDCILDPPGHGISRLAVEMKNRIHIYIHIQTIFWWISMDISESSYPGYPWVSMDIDRFLKQYQQNIQKILVV